MQLKLIVNAFLAIAIFIATIIGFVIFNKREAIARAEAIAAEARENVAKEESRKARSEEATEKSKEETAKANLAKAEVERKQKIAEAEKASADAAIAADAKAKAQEDRAKAAALAESANATRDAEKAKAEASRHEAEKAKQLAKAEESRAASSAALLEREKLASERVKAEVELRKLQKENLAEYEQALIAYKNELDERERMLRPDKTVEDLVWVSKDDMIIDADGNVVREEKKVYLPENDKTLAKETRALAKAERTYREKNARREAAHREVVIRTLEKLYENALKEDRIPDAEFYKKTILSLYPDHTKEEKESK